MLGSPVNQAAGGHSGGGWGENNDSAMDNNQVVQRAARGWGTQKRGQRRLPWEDAIQVES